MAGSSAVLFTLTLLVTMKVVVLQRSGGYACTNQASQYLFNCLENPKIRISKTERQYNIRLCSDEGCSSRLNWFRCQDICATCRELLGRTEDCSSGAVCEYRVDKYLNNYCASALPRTINLPSTTATPITPSQCIVTTTVTPSCTKPPTFINNGIMLPVSQIENQSEQLATQETASPVVILGSLFSLSMLLLAIVTIGWVYTCWILKRRKDEKSKGIVTIGANYDELERYFKNPTYEGSFSQKVATYDTVNLSSHTTVNGGHMYDIPDQRQAKEHTEARGGGNSNTGESTSSPLNGERNYYVIDKDFLSKD